MIKLLPVAESLRRLVERNELPTCLVPERSRQAIESVSARLPNAMCASGFECRLSNGERLADFATWVTPESGGVAAIAAIGRDGADADLAQAPEWRRLIEFCRWWLDRGSEPAGLLQFVILEFDTDSSAERTIVPSIFLGLVPRARQLAGLENPSADHIRWLSELALPRLRGGPLPEPIVAELDRCYEALPPGGAFLHLAALLSRDTEAVRVYAMMPTAAAASYLRAIGREDAASDLLGLWWRCVGDTPRLQIQFDVAETVGPRISIEFPLRSQLSGRAGEDPERVLAQLEAEGLCAPEKRKALLAWPKEYAVSARESIVQELSHLKVARSGRGEFEAKGYFYFTHTTR